MNRRSLSQLRALLVAILLLPSAGIACAGNIFVPNGSFELPPTPSAGITNEFWEDQPMPPGANPIFWFESMGIFANTAPGSLDHLGNMDGSQAAFVFNTQGAGYLQDFNTADLVTFVPTHTFNAHFEVGRSYHLTAAFTSSFNEQLPQGASMQMSLYYRDASNKIVNVAATNVVFETNVFDPITNFTDFTVTAPTVNPNDAWAGQNIGIEFLVTTSDTNLETGFWDLDNVRLTSTITVPNGSFELPQTDSVSITNQFWQDEPQPSFFDPSTFGSWFTFMGHFANTDPGTFDHLDNIDGTQAAYIVAFPGAGFFQDITAVDLSGVPPAHPFDVTLDAGKSYTVTAALTSSSDEPLTNGAAIDVGIYYLGASNNMVMLADTNVVFDASVFTNIDHLLDFSATIPDVKTSDPWAGKTLGIQIMATTFNPAPSLGVWDVDNVRLSEKVATAFSGAAVSNGQINMTLQSEPGAVFQILAATNITTAPAGWQSIATITNTSGSAVISDATTNKVRFYKARQLP